MFALCDVDSDHVQAHKICPFVIKEYEKGEIKRIRRGKEEERKRKGRGKKIEGGHVALLSKE